MTARCIPGLHGAFIVCCVIQGSRSTIRRSRAKNIGGGTLSECYIVLDFWFYCCNNNFVAYAA